MNLLDRRTNDLAFCLPLSTGNENFSPLVEQNYEDFIFRDTISRKQYVFGTLKEKKKKLTINRRKGHFHEARSVIEDAGGHTQVLSNIKQYRFNELLGYSKSSNKLKGETQKEQLSKYKQSMLKIRANLIESISNYNTSCFRKYLADGSGFDSRLNMVKRIETQKVTQEQLQRFIKELNSDSSNKQLENLEAQQKKKARNEAMGKKLDQEFEAKYRRQYDILEADIRSKIKGQANHLAEPQSQDYKSVKPSIGKHKTIFDDYQQQFQQHLSQIKNRSLNIMDKFKSMRGIQMEAKKESPSKFSYLESLIIADNTFDLQWQLNQHPQYLELVDERGNSLLHIAAKQSRLDVCKTLISKQIDAKMRNNMGYTPEKVAQHFNQPEIKLLIEKHNSRYDNNY